MNKNDNLKMVFLIAFSFVIGGIVTISLLKWTPLLSKIISTSTTAGTVITKGGAEVYEKTSLSSSVKKVYDSVAVVEGYQQNQLASTGTGFIYKVDDKYGYVLTNQHVISGMEKIDLIMTNDEVVEAKLLGGDEYLDLAVLRIDKAKVIQIATIGKSENMNIGDTVFTVGSPMGKDYRGSVTSGILSGKDRMVAVNISNSANNDWVMRVLQIDASINPGNSGGPLLNVNGEVIGICSLKLVDAEIEGMGFAIPIEYAMNHLTSLEKGEKIKWPLLGIGMCNVTDTSTLYRNGIILSSDIIEGVAVVSISENTAASNSGIKKGDVIIKINGNKVKDSAYLRYELYQHQAGDKIEVTVLRDKKEKQIEVKLGKSN